MEEDGLTWIVKAGVCWALAMPQGAVAISYQRSKDSVCCRFYAATDRETMLSTATRELYPVVCLTVTYHRKGRYKENMKKMYQYAKECTLHVKKEISSMCG